jgi:hypothetical protein
MVLVDPSGTLQLFTAGTTQLGLHASGGMLRAAPRQVHKGPGIAVRTGLITQLNLFTFDAQQGSSLKRGMQNRQCAAQRSAGMLLICIRPEQGR